MRRLLSLAAAVAVLTGALAVASPAAAASTNGATAGIRISMATIDIGPGYWSLGDHYYYIQFNYAPSCGCGTDTEGPFYFSVDDSAPLYKGNVELQWQHQGHIWASGWIAVPNNTINPAQGTFFWAAWVSDFSGASYTPPDTMQTARAFVAASSIYFSWDGGGWVLGHQGPITSITANGYGLTKPVSAFFHRTWGN